VHFGKSFLDLTNQNKPTVNLSITENFKIENELLVMTQIRLKWN